MKKSLVIFDLDGTLIDSAPDLADGIDGMLAYFDKPPATVANVRTWVGNGSIKLVETALAWANLPSNKLHEAHEFFLQTYKNCQDKTIEYMGVTDGLNHLTEHGLTLAICTNKPSQFLPDILAKMGWTDKFTYVIGGDDLPVKKPDPMPLLHICEILNVNKDQAIMVGDSKNDITAGKQAGITTLALTYGYNYGIPISDSNPDEVFDDFGELVAFILNDLQKSPK